MFQARFFFHFPSNILLDYITLHYIKLPFDKKEREMCNQMIIFQ